MSLSLDAQHHRQVEKLWANKEKPDVVLVTTLMIAH